jgi:hypothetical protein
MKSKYQNLDLLFYWGEINDYEFVKKQIENSSDSVAIFTAPGNRFLFKEIKKPKGFDFLTSFRYTLALKKYNAFTGFISPFFYMFDIARFFFYLWSRFAFRGLRVKVLITNSAYHGLCFALLRKLNPHYIQKMVWISGDWMHGNTTRMSVWSYFGYQFVHPRMDRCMVEAADHVLHTGAGIITAREKYWNREFPHARTLYEMPLEMYFPKSNIKQLNPTQRAMLFSGNTRSDSGLIHLIPLLKKNSDLVLHLVGKPNQHLQQFLNLAIEKEKLTSQIVTHGFVPQNKMEAIVNQCFCGLNLIDQPGSYTVMTLPGKIMDYIQYGLPTLTTPFLGEYWANQVSHHRIGLVVDPNDQEQIHEALENLWEQHDEYYENLKTYIHQKPHTNFNDYL